MNARDRAKYDERIRNLASRCGMDVFKSLNHEGDEVLTVECSYEALAAFYKNAYDDGRHTK